MFPSSTKAERIADGLIHGVSLIFVLVAGAFLIGKVHQTGDAVLLTGTLIYALFALVSIGFSSAYHLLPRHDLRATLRRWDHAAIYPIIAGTFTPLLLICGTLTTYVVLAVMWLTAIAGVVFKLLAQQLDPRWSLASYLGLGWFAIFAVPDFWIALPRATIGAIAAGAVFYTIGTAFYRRKGMRFRYPIWHGFGTLGGASFLLAIWMAIPVG